MGDVMRKFLMTLSVLQLTACNAEPPYQCKEIPDRATERRQMDDSLKITYASRGQNWEATPELQRSRDLQDRVDEMIRKANAEHGCET